MNPFYTRGFDAGYKMGYRSGLDGSAARTVMNRDLIWAYGCMALVLIEKHGWTAEEADLKAAGKILQTYTVYSCPEFEEG